MKYKFLIVAFLSATAVSCTDSSSSGGGGGGGPKATPTPAANQVGCQGSTGVTSWQSGIGSIFQTSCVSCHAQYGTYAGVSGSINGIISQIDSGTMPRGSVMAAADKASIHAWITAGMPQVSSATPTVSPGSANSGCVPTPTPSPAPTSTALVATYSGGIQSIMSTYCVSCHSQYGSQSSVSQNYNQIMSKVSSGAMPRGMTMPSDKIQLLRQWGTYPNAPYGQFAP